MRRVFPVRFYYLRYRHVSYILNSEMFVVHLFCGTYRDHSILNCFSISNNHTDGLSNELLWHGRRNTTKNNHLSKFVVVVVATKFCVFVCVLWVALESVFFWLVNNRPDNKWASFGRFCYFFSIWFDLILVDFKVLSKRFQNCQVGNRRKR